MPEQILHTRNECIGLLHPGNLKKGLSRPIAAASKENTKIDHKNSKNKIKAERKKRKKDGKGGRYV